MIEVDAIAERDELVGVVLLSDVVYRVQQANDVLGEDIVMFGDFLRECHAFAVINGL